MPAADDHPMRLLRLRANLTQVELARRASVNRATIAALEEGRVQRPNDAVMQALASATGVTVTDIAGQVTAWRKTPVEADKLTQRAKNTLMLPPHMVAQYKSFAQWRRDVAPNPTNFASLLKIPLSTLIKYEKGDSAMPRPLYGRLHDQLGLSYEYIEELRKLDV